MLKVAQIALQIDSLKSMFKVLPEEHTKRLELIHGDLVQLRNEYIAMLLYCQESRTRIAAATELSDATVRNIGRDYQGDISNDRQLAFLKRFRARKERAIEHATQNFQ